MNIRTISIYILLIFYGSIPLNNSCYGASSNDIPRQTPCKSQLEVVGMLRSNDYEGLEASLRTCQTNYEKDINAEIALYSAYAAFNSSRPSLEPALNEWVRRYPSSYAARTARGIYLTHKGYRARGYQWASDTAEEQFQAMEETYRFAVQDLKDAVNRYPKSLVAYCGLIDISGTSGSKDDKRKYVDMGLRELPDSLMIRQKHLHYLQSKWGGTESDRDEAMAEIDRSSRRYEKLHVLQGYRLIMRADAFVDQKKYDMALPLYLQAIQYGDLFYYYERLGMVYYLLKKYDQATVAYTKAVQIGPLGLSTIQNRAFSMMRAGYLAEAMSEVDLGLSLFPEDKYLIELRDHMRNPALATIQQKSFALIEAGLFAEAREEIDLGLSRYPDDRYLLALREHCEKSDLASIQKRAYALIKAGSYAEAMKEIDIGLSRFPGDKYLGELRGTYSKNGR